MAASPRWRLGVCLALAALLHVLALAWVDLPAMPTPPPHPTLAIALQPLAAPSAPPAAAVPTANRAGPAAAATVTAPALRTPAAPSVEAPAAPRLGAVHDLARAIANRHAAERGSPRSERALRLPESPARPDFAYYLRAWRRDVERVGKLNYPAQARRRDITGSLRLLVVISADGTLVNVRILESSGHAVLDAAALRIVRLAAPFAPFPASIRALADTLEIERVWRFQGEAGALL